MTDGMGDGCHQEPTTFPWEGGAFTFAKADCRVFYAPAASRRPCVRSRDADNRKERKRRHGKANDSRGQEAHGLPPPAGLDSRPDSGRQGSQQVHHPPRDNQPLGPVRQGLQALEPHLRALRRMPAHQGLRKGREAVVQLHAAALRGLPGLRRAGVRAAGRPVPRLQRMPGLQVLPGDEAPLRRRRGAGEQGEPPARLALGRPPGRGGAREDERGALPLHHGGGSP